MRSESLKKRVAIIGTNGIPAKYGGFETLAENLVDQLNSQFDFIVYCSKIYNKTERVSIYKNARLVYLPFKANGIQSLFYDLFSFVHALIFAKTILFLGPTSSGIIIYLNIIFRRKIIVNHGGLNEWEREKYGKYEKKWARLNHLIAAKNATINITDNSILQLSLLKNFDTNSEIIRYGGDHNNILNFQEELIKDYSFLNNNFYLSVARAQVDNNIHLLIDAFINIDTYPLVVISNWDISDYGKNLFEKYKNHPNLILIDAIYDTFILNQIRKKCYLYIHSHSYCGTSPSLVEIMNLGVPIICYDVQTNRETTNNKSIYFNSIESLQKIIQKIDSKQLLECKKAMYSIAKEEYTWEKVSSDYLKVL